MLAPGLESEVWTPAPRTVVLPARAAVEGFQLAMPEPFERFDAPPVFICGSGRSGTTWTLDLFERHPLVSTVCESWILSQTHGLTSLLAQEYWDVEIRAAWEQRVDVPFGAVQLLTYEEAVRDLGELLGRWLVRQSKPDHRFLVAKEPLDVTAAAILFPDARFVHVVRDGRDVALSGRRASVTWDPSMGVDLPMALRALGWKRNVENVRQAREILGGRYLELRYEDMTNDVERSIRSLFDFASIPYDDSLVDTIREATTLSSYGEHSQKSGFRGGSLGRTWRSQFTPREVIAFHLAAGDLLVDLGYERDSTWWRSGAWHAIRNHAES